MLRKLAILLISIAFLNACSGKTDPSVNSGTSQASSGGYNNNVSSSSSTAIIPGSQEDLSVNIGDRVFFAYDSSIISSEAQVTLMRQVEWLNRYPHLNVIVEGHCDERGTREYNLGLGERRATSVKNFLINSGVPSNRIRVISYGKERPAVFGSNESSWRQNRRGVLVID